MKRIDSVTIIAAKIILYIGMLVIIGDAIQLGAMGQVRSPFDLLGMGIFGISAFLAARRLHHPALWPKLITALLFFYIFILALNAALSRTQEWGEGITLFRLFLLAITGTLGTRIAYLGFSDWKLRRSGDKTNNL